MTFLLDVNVVIALLDEFHVHAAVVQRWFAARGDEGWALCPLVENGALRIIGHSRYPGSPGSPAGVAAALASLRQSAGFTFWSDDISLLDARRVDAGLLRTSAQLTDTYLLALAVLRGGRLATLDRRLATDAVVGGAQALHVIG